MYTNANWLHCRRLAIKINLLVATVVNENSKDWHYTCTNDHMIISKLHMQHFCVESKDYSILIPLPCFMQLFRSRQSTQIILFTKFSNCGASNMATQLKHTMGCNATKSHNGMQDSYIIIFVTQNQLITISLPYTQDLLMVVYLANLTKTQLMWGERLQHIPSWTQ